MFSKCWQMGAVLSLCTRPLSQLELPGRQVRGGNRRTSTSFVSGGMAYGVPRKGPQMSQPNGSPVVAAVANIRSWQRLCTGGPPPKPCKQSAVFILNRHTKPSAKRAKNNS